MTKKEKADLHSMHKLTAHYFHESCLTLKKLWDIGDKANIEHWINFEYMVLQIVKSSVISDADKEKSLALLRKYAYSDGRREERIETGHALKCSTTLTLNKVIYYLYYYY
jgi:hypothetical protein